MRQREFVKRCRQLGCDTAHAAAQRLSLPPSSISRMWAGTRPVSARVVRCLEDVEAQQPVRYLSPLMERVLLTELDGSVVVPPARSNFERGIEWGDVIDDMERAGLFARAPAGLPPWRLSGEGKRAAAWLRVRGYA